VSSTVSHHTGRTLPLDFRAATALFGAFGIEWNLEQATEVELGRLAAWVRLHKKWRSLLHTGRMVRVDLADPAVAAYGAVAADRREALFAHVQLDESASSRGVTLRLPGLDPEGHYTCEWVTPDGSVDVAGAEPLDPAGPTGGERVTGSDLARSGLWLPKQRPETVRLIAVRVEGR
jgi:alpha-galactosidase